jgi:hypothetical protein
LLRQLREAAADDQERAYTATWSRERLRTLLVHVCLGHGHQVVEPTVPGTPAHQPPGRGQPALADLQVVPRHEARALAVDLLTARSGAEGLVLSVVHRAIERVAAGHTDAVLISADADAYDRVLEPSTGVQAARMRQLVTAALPRAGRFQTGQATTWTTGDVTLATVGTAVHAFGGLRVVCTVHVMAN